MSETILLIGTRKGLWVARSRDRVSWQVDPPQFLMQEIYAAAIDTRPARPRLLVGASSLHWGPSVSRSEDLGATWSEPEEGAIRFPEDTGAALQRVWQLTPGTPEEPDVVYAGSEPSALWRSEDGGQSFSLVRGLWDHPHREHWWPGGGGQAIHTIIPHPSRCERVAVAMSTGGVYQTEDSGQTWLPTNSGIGAEFLPEPAPEYGQCVHKVALNRSRPDQLFAQNHPGVYRSNDGGRQWTSIGEGLPSAFGFPIVVHPHRPGTVYVVPLAADVQRIPPDAALRVWRTTDAGESWHALGEGLPDGPAYTAVLRDALCTDEQQQLGLYFGTRDGAVYASADEGESWDMVVNRLPDVLCVRAATVNTP